MTIAAQSIGGAIEAARLIDVAAARPGGVPRRRGDGAAGPGRARGGRPELAAVPRRRYFVVGCGFSHLNNDDPIAFPGQPGKSHNHTFIGNRAVDASTTPASLLGGDSSCGDVGDASAYWVPTLFAGRRALRPLVGVGYYVRRTNGPVRAFPAGLKMIAGNPNARRPQSLSVVGWACGGFGAAPRSAVGADCAPDRLAPPARDVPELLERARPRQRRPQRHLAYASGGRCPRSHPVALPSLVLIFLYPSTESGRPVQASGRFGTHADFVNGWEQDTLEALVAALN